MLPNEKYMNLDQLNTKTIEVLRKYYKRGYNTSPNKKKGIKQNYLLYKTTQQGHNPPILYIP